MGEGLQAGPPTPEAITALLREAGFRESAGCGSPVSHCDCRTPGFEVVAVTASVVTIRHESASHGDVARKRASLLRYSEAILAARPEWAVTFPGPRDWLRLTVMPFVTAEGGE